MIWRVLKAMQRPNLTVLLAWLSYVQTFSNVQTFLKTRHLKCLLICMLEFTCQAFICQ